MTMLKESKAIERHFRKVAPKIVHGKFGPSMTDPQYCADSDINEILRKYNCGGTLPPSRGGGRYADVSEFGDYADMMNRVVKAREDFEALPAEVRARFGNNPEAFYAFVSNPDNAQDCVKLGLAVNREKPVEKVMKVEVVNNGVTPSGGVSA